MAETEMPIFTRTFDLLSWLLPATNDFQRAHRYSATQRLLDAAFDLRERLEEANLRRGGARIERLERADEALALLRPYLRLAVRWGWLSAAIFKVALAIARGGLDGLARDGVREYSITRLRDPIAMANKPRRPRRGRLANHRRGLPP